MAQGQSTTTYDYDANNRLTAEIKNTNGTNQTTKYTYDGNGNQLTKSINGARPDSYMYDEFDRLVYAVVNGQTIQYAYNADGLRISKTIGSATTKQYWDGTNIVNEADQNGNLKNTYIRGTSLIGVIDASGTRTMYLFNGHGDVVGLANGNGNVEKSYDYDIFGNEKNIDPKDTNPFRYAGEYYDNETGDYYLRARYYNPADGRFISEDTYEGDVKDPLSLNWYTYCEDDPVNGVDPSGHFANLIKWYNNWCKSQEKQEYKNAKTIATLLLKVEHVKKSNPKYKKMLKEFTKENYETTKFGICMVEGLCGSGEAKLNFEVKGASEAWSTVMEESSVTRLVDSLTNKQKGIFDNTIDKLAKGDTTGLNVHALKGDKKGWISADLKGFGKGRGNARIYYTESHGKIIIKEIDLAHQK